MIHFKKLILFLAYSLITGNLYSQDLGEWSIYPSYSTVNSIALTNDGTQILSTLGGIFEVKENEVLDTFSTLEGMHRLDPKESIYDTLNDRVIFGYTDGTLDVFSVKSKSFSTIQDITRTEQFPSKQINVMKKLENELYIGTDFGIVILDLNELFIRNSYLTLGEFERGTAINDIDFSGDSIYVATEKGIAIASILDNLIESSSWRNYDESDGLESNIVDRIVNFNGKTYAISDSKSFLLQNRRWEINSDFGPSEITRFVKTDSELGVIFTNSLLIESLSGSQEEIVLSAGTSILDVRLSDEEIAFGTADQGLVTVNRVSKLEQSFLPDGPYLNFFSELNQSESVLISTSTTKFPQSDPFNPIRGYYLFEDDNWSNYNQSTNEVLATSNFGSVYSTSNTSDHFYFGSWGQGIGKHEISTNEISVANASNSELTGIFNGGNFVVISGLSGDSNDNMWAVSFDSDKPLNLQQKGSDEWLGFERLTSSVNDLYFNLFIDSNNLKWITLNDFNYDGKGLLILDTKDVTDTSDDEFRKLTSDPNNGNLPDDLVTTITEDKNGEVWIGTERGIARFIFPNFIIGSSNPNDYEAQWLINEDTSAISRFLLRDVNVSSIAVNEANQKWIGSINQGLWLLNEDGSSILKRFTKENSPLISDNILSITVNDLTGEVFISTDLGLVSYSDLPKAPVNKMDKLKVFPNPFSYSKHSSIIIDELSESTDIKVLGIDGTVVNEFETKGGRVSWNGFDYNGNELATGVYFIVSLGKNGNEKGIGKVIIVR